MPVPRSSFLAPYYLVSLLPEVLPHRQSHSIAYPRNILQVIEAGRLEPGQAAEMA
jgi:hypothetical protein